jgi:hypothetical protein
MCWWEARQNSPLYFILAASPHDAESTWTEAHVTGHSLWARWGTMSARGVAK